MVTVTTGTINACVERMTEEWVRVKKAVCSIEVSSADSLRLFKLGRNKKRCKAKRWNYRMKEEGKA